MKIRRGKRCNVDAKRNEDLRKELNETKQGLKQAMSELAKIKEANARAETAQEETKHALKKALAELANLKAAGKKETTTKSNSTNEATPSEDDVDIDTRESEHYPLFLHSVDHSRANRTQRPRWQYVKADWTKFTNEIN